MPMRAELTSGSVLSRFRRPTSSRVWPSPRLALRSGLSPLLSRHFLVSKVVAGHLSRFEARKLMMIAGLVMTLLAGQPPWLIQEVGREVTFTGVTKVVRP